MRTKLSPSKELTVNKINQLVNAYPPVKESYADGMTASDLRITKRGSCGDYAYTKLVMLLEQGFPSACMGIATCELTHSPRPDGMPQRHAVLILSTTNGDYVLDNRVNYLRTIAGCGEEYTWVSIPQHLTGEG